MLGGFSIRRNRTLLLGGIAVIAAGLLTAVLVVILQGDGDNKASPPHRFVYVDFSFSSPPVLGREVNLTVRVKPIPGVEVDKSRIEMTLPEGITFISGNLIWEGNILEDTSAEVTAVVTATQQGEWVVKALTDNRLRYGFHRESKYLKVTVSEKAATVEEYVPIEPIGHQASDRGTVD